MAAKSHFSDVQVMIYVITLMLEEKKNKTGLLDLMKYL